MNVNHFTVFSDKISFFDENFELLNDHKASRYHVII